MENNSQNNSNQNAGHDKLRESVLEKIRKGEVHMTPKAYFTLKVIALILMSLLVLLTSALLLSFIVFSIRVSGRFFLLGYGMRGFEIFLVTFPWKFLIIDIIFIFILEWLFKQFKFGYRNSLLTLLLGIFSITVIAGILIEVSPLHHILLHEADRRHLPPALGDFYNHIRRSPEEEGVFRGVVTSIHNNTFVISPDPDENMQATSTVVVPPNVNLSAFLHIGDEVFVAGNRDHLMIRAYGISKITDPDEIATSTALLH